MRLNDTLDLTYCTNIHPGDGWADVSAQLARYGPALKSRLAPGGPFGLGVRLSNREAVELLEGQRLQEFAAFLDARGLYVSLLNGYPYGAFHGAPVKTAVFKPDWRDDERVRYTLRLLAILAGLLPEGGNGGISTLPLSYKPWVRASDRAAMSGIVGNVVRVAAAMVEVARTTGRTIRLELEPEPDGLLENTEEVLAFFRDWLLPHGSRELATAARVSAGEAERLLLEHVGLCFDTCHFAVEYEDAGHALDAFAAAGIRIGRVQVSSALNVTLPGGDLAAALSPFADSTYLHQVVERREDGSLRRYRDLDEALAAVDGPAPREWRIHFHVPLFTSEYGRLGSTQAYNAGLLKRLAGQPATGHFEIETYTWDVLPPALKLDLTDSIEREYRWVLEHV